MAHAGTMVGGSAQTKQNGSPLAAIALAAAVVVATVAGVWLASNAGFVGGAAKPAADRSYDQIEAQRGVITLSGGSSLAYDERLNGILDQAHAAPYAGTVVLSSDQTRAIDEKLNGILDRAHAAPYAGAAVTLSSHQIRAQNARLNAILDEAHATPYAGDAPGLPFSATSGTFHPGNPADQVVAPFKRDRIGGE